MNGTTVAVLAVIFFATLIRLRFWFRRSLVSLAGYWLAELWVADVTRYYLLSLPLQGKPFWDNFET